MVMELRPRHLTLREVIVHLLEETDQDRVIPLGFTNPHSYRGIYEALAFEVASNVTVRSMLEAAISAKGATYEGWKGGEFKMDDYTEVYLVAEEGTCGESLGQVLLWFMLGRHLV